MVSEAEKDGIRACVRGALRVASRIRDARENPEVFIEACVRDQRGKFIRLGEIHRCIWKFIRENLAAGQRRMIIEVPRGHGKTTEIAVGFVAWCIGRDPFAKILIVSNTDPQAKSKADGIKRIMTSEAYRLVFPDVEPDSLKWAAEWFRFKLRDGTPAGDVRSYGISSGLTGSRATGIILDDPCDAENSLTSKIEREGVWTKISADVFKTLVPGGWVIWIGTPWHGYDAMQMALGTGEFAHLKIALADADPETNQYTHFTVSVNGERVGTCPLWWEPEEYAKRRRESTDIADFERAYHLRILSKGTQTFPSFDRTLHFRGNQPLPASVTRGRIFVGCDPSSKTRRGTIVVVGSIGNDGVVRVFEAYSLANPSGIPDLFVDIDHRLRPELFAVEGDAQQDALVDQWGEETHLEVVSIQTGARKLDPILGLAGLETAFRRYQWEFYIPYSSESEIPSDSIWARLIREFRNHLIEARNTEDCVMACYMLYRAKMHYWESEDEEDEVSLSRHSDRDEDYDPARRKPISEIVKEEKRRVQGVKYPAFCH